MVAAMKHMALNFVKLDKFEGVDFRSWQKKMHFLLSSMSVVYVLTTLMPEDGGDNPTVEQVRKRAKWDNDDYVCRGLILNGICLIFTRMLKLPKNYGIPWRPNIWLRMPQVSCIIDKLPLSWKDFKHTLKHSWNNTMNLLKDFKHTLKYLKEELTLVELGSHLRIEESLMAQDSDKPKGNNVAGLLVVNMVEHNNSSRYNDNRNKRKHHDTKADPNKKLKVTCLKCGKPGHLKNDCKAGQNMFNKSLQIYYVTYVFEAYFVQDDDVAWFCYVYLLPSKDEALDKFKVFKTKVELQQGSLIKRFRTDRGGEYMDTLYFQSVGIIHEMTAPYTPQQNGISEKKNKVLKEMVNYMLSYSGLSQGFWGEAMAVVRLPDPKLKTLGERGIECIFVGYVEHSKAFRFYVIEPNESVAINSIIESRDAIVDENRFSSVPRPSQRSLVNGIEDSGGSVVSKNVTDEVVQQPEPDLRKSKRHRTPKDFRPEFQLYLIKGTRDEVSNQHSYCSNVEDDPKTFDEAMKPLGCKWIFKIKLKVDGTVEKFKARLVIQGFKQKSRIDYFDTYAPMARISTIRLLIAMVSIHSLIIHQMDVKTAFLNGELDEEVYMNQPRGFIMPGNENKVCKLIKSLYGLKHAPKQCHQKFDEVVLSNCYLLNQADKCVYSKFDESGKGVIFCLYVDDMLIFGTDDLTKEFLLSRFSMKDIGEADVILGIKINQESNGIEISQSHYIEKVLKKFNYFDCTPVSTLIDTSKKLMPNNGQAVSQLEYSRVIGCLMYAMTCTRPDIAFAVGKLSRYTSNPYTEHWQAIQRVLKYLKKTIDYRLMYTGYPLVLEGYTDASRISNFEDNSSTSGWVFLLATGKEAEWLKNLLLEILLWAKPIAPISIRCDSVATLAKAYSLMYNGKSRHLGVRHNMICELITNGVVSLDFVRSQQNLANHLMKGLARDLVIKSAEGMGLKMCLEPVEKEDEVVNFLMVNFFEKVLSRSMNKEEPSMYSNGFKGSILRTP
ncbi:zinc finger, CCHC-type containing protein [Tanacetum coccineum]